MPVYEYICKCGYTVTYYLTMGNRNREFDCPVCGKSLTKLIGKGSIFNLKGEGYFKKGIQ